MQPINFIRTVTVLCGRCIRVRTFAHVFRYSRSHAHCRRHRRVACAVTSHPFSPFSHCNRIVSIINEPRLGFTWLSLSLLRAHTHTHTHIHATYHLYPRCCTHVSAYTTILVDTQLCIHAVDLFTCGRTTNDETVGGSFLLLWPRNEIRERTYIVHTVLRKNLKPPVLSILPCRLNVTFWKKIYTSYTRWSRNFFRSPRFLLIIVVISKKMMNKSVVWKKLREIWNRRNRKISENNIHR